MAVSPTPEQRESFLDITVQTRRNSSLDPVALAYGDPVLLYKIDILTLVIALVGLVGNSIVLWLLCFRLQRSPFSVYILNLAASDALFLGSCFVVCIREIVGYLNTLVLKLLWAFILKLTFFMGLSLLAAISTERCLSVLFPIWYRCQRPKHTSAAVCAILWTLLGLYWGVFVALHFLRKLYILYPALAYLKIWWFSLLTCVLCVSSLTLVLRVQCSSQHRRLPRLYFLILLTVLVFLLCGLPFGIIHALRWFTGFPLMPLGLPRLLACVNSSANPFIYFWAAKGIEEGSPSGWSSRGPFEEEQEVGVGTRDTSHTNTLDMSP